jgi:hypothetical protein
MPILKQTVFVLGAGANKNYGFPLGIELRDKVISKLFSRPFHKLLMELGHSEAEIEALRDELRYSAHTSVDAFLEHNPAFLEIGKRAIAATLLPREDGHRLFPPGANAAEHWYEYLINKMGVGTKAWARNRLSVITFNYDRSFEHYFTEVIRHRANVPPHQAYKLFQQVRLLHVHGSLGNYPPGEPEGLAYETPPTRESVAAAAEGILVVSEVKDTLPTFAEAEKLLSAADHIHFIGFGFLPANVRRLRIFDQEWRRDATRPVIQGTAVGVTRKEWDYVEKNLLRDRWHREPSRASPKQYLRNFVEFD